MTTRKTLPIIALCTLFTLGTSSPVLAQSVIDEARKLNTEQLHKARVSEARDLLREREQLQSRLSNIEKRLIDLDNGAKPIELQTSTYTWGLPSISVNYRQGSCPDGSIYRDYNGNTVSC